MARWVRDQGNQTPILACERTEDGQHARYRPEQKRRREDEEGDILGNQQRFYGRHDRDEDEPHVHRRRVMTCRGRGQQPAECDIPYPSVEPLDSPAMTPPAGPAAPDDAHVFYILHERKSEALDDLRLLSRSPPSIQRPASHSPSAWAWSDGSDFKASSYDEPWERGQAFPYSTHVGSASPPKTFQCGEYPHYVAGDPDSTREHHDEKLPSSVPILVRQFVVQHQYPTPITSRSQPPPLHTLRPSYLPLPRRATAQSRQTGHDGREATPLLANLLTRRARVQGPMHEPSQHQHGGKGEGDERGEHGDHNNHNDHGEYGGPYPGKAPGSCAVLVHSGDSDDLGGELLMSDAEAATSVAKHMASFHRRYPASRHARILLGLIQPKSANAEFELDNCALQSIFSAANELFFNGRLTQRVQWAWSDAAASPQYDSEIIGHTSLRRARGGGFETFILLSTPILKNPTYNRRLLISAFLHELIHCYLFICCGWSARASGGHTDGFRAIAGTIDRWAGRENLYLCHVEADLERFRQTTKTEPSHEDVLASSAFYDDRVCCVSRTDADWERHLHDRWDHVGDGQFSDSASFQSRRT
ncbi:hypothetical protein SPI_00396 [Niveomyces insectorum RCEF 264]|uniref:SprT-like domain-containing protein n=1 Tax=Niveomyces insectorum RCEF 264 TaxID=1081102 RepID=A0A168A3N9_9HYPO|nr:hypothetical protein SPI_00396 [Niveomyces insectorum RCEF 264]